MSCPTGYLYEQRLKLNLLGDRDMLLVGKTDSKLSVLRLALHEDLQGFNFVVINEVFNLRVIFC